MPGGTSLAGAWMIPLAAETDRVGVTRSAPLPGVSAIANTIRPTTQSVRTIRPTPRHSSVRLPIEVSGLHLYLMSGCRCMDASRVIREQARLPESR
jgi:hypothetical protein